MPDVVSKIIGLPYIDDDDIILPDDMKVADYEGGLMLTIQNYLAYYEQHGSLQYYTLTHDVSIMCDKCGTVSRLSEWFFSIDCPFCHAKHKDIALCQ